LLQSKGRWDERFSAEHTKELVSKLEAFLSEEHRKSVWYLKQFVISEDDTAGLVPAVGVDYGFWNCKSQEDKQDLKKVYRQFFSHRDTNPVDLHNAAIQGNLFEYVGKFVKLRKKFKKLMVNPYPLAVFE